MGRAKGSRNRNRIGPVRPYLVRLPIEVADRVDAAAAAEGVPVAAWIRRVVAEAARVATNENAAHPKDERRLPMR